MPSEQIQWFPGHMAKTRRMISENLKSVNIVIELLDARIPDSSRNPEIVRLTEGKPRLTLLSRAALADPAENKSYAGYYKSRGERCIFYDCATGEGLSSIASAAFSLCGEKFEAYRRKGAERHVKAMVLGIPNVGKSTLINRLSGSARTKAEDRPGVTRDKQWVRTSCGIDFLDMPGILWPKFEDRRVGENLALTGAVKNEILDTDELARVLIKRLRRRYPELLLARYGLDAADISDDKSEWDVVLTVGRKRGFLLPGGETDGERASKTLLLEFRTGKIGRISLESPPSKL